jgi:hypothetical protein
MPVASVLIVRFDLRFEFRFDISGGGARGGGGEGGGGEALM